MLKPGDQVCIRPDWWDVLAHSEKTIPLYIQNGRDYVYTVRSVYGNSVFLKEDDGSWNETFLIPAEEADLDEPPITGLTDLL